ncbi:RHS repeat-associated protein [Leifsonia sp. 563]|uniref:RHS repeat domain-containing protein n=1 Tax=Leifsonia sp. 563 TaxID=3156412 RepID=UPI00339715D4
MTFSTWLTRSSALGGLVIATLVAATLQGAPSSAAEAPTPPAWAKVVPGSAAKEHVGKGGTPPESAAISTAPAPTGDYQVDIDGGAKGESIAVDDTAGRSAVVVDGKWHPVGDTGLTVASAGDTQSAADARKQLEASKMGTAKAKAKDRAEKVSVKFLPSASAEKLGAAGPIVQLSRADGSATEAAIGVRIPTKVLAAAYGADFASRAHWVQLDGTALPKSGKDLRKKATSVPSEVDSESGTVTAAPTIGRAPVLMMALATATGASGTGDFTATSLKPSAAWDVSAQTGTFSWKYPLRIPPAPAGPAPDLALSYDSQSVDGLTGSTNNQPSAIGEGWSLAGSGFIERSYVGCAVDDGASGPVKTSGDLCFKNANATVSFAGHSGELIRVGATNQYRLAADDGTRFTEYKGAPCASNGTADTACWQMVTTDGTQYFFGLNQLPGYVAGKPTTNSAWTVPVFGNDAGEPCHADTFAASSCQLAWRWNLDYVVDVHGNAEAYYYNAQTNMYAKNGSTATAYVRGGELEHIEYGLSASTVFGANAASGKVFFSYDKNGRCSDGSGAQCTTQPAAGNAVKPANAASYPDIPFDQLCASGTCAGLVSPTFWTTSKLSTVKTQVLSAGTYKDVDSWALKQSFPAPGDGTSPALWLDSVTHTGYSGTATLTEPTVSFGGAVLQNRVWAVDGLAPLDKWRIGSIKTELGATVSVNYSAQECVPADRAAIFAAPQSNIKRCYPQWWSPSVTPPQAPQQDLFHKYVVTSVIDNPNTGGAGAPAVEKYYVYGTPAWRYNDSPLAPAEKRTWSIFAGFDTTEVRVGQATKPSEQNVTKYTFFRGLDGDKASPAGGVKSVQVGGVPDYRPFAGKIREQVAALGVGGAVLSTTTTTPWGSAPTANDGVHSSWYTGDSQVVVVEPVSTGGTRSTTTTTSYDPTWGLPTSVQTTHTDAPATCVTTTYAPANTSRHLIGSVAESLTTAGTCDQAATAEADRLISDVRTSYDGQAPGAAPTTGDPTTVETVTSMTGTSKTWSTIATTGYDAMGRTVQVTDALNRITKTAYTPAGTGGPTTKVVVTNPLGWTSSTEFDPAWGAVLKATDENSKITSASYDALGRRTGVWLPNKSQTTYPTAPSTKYTYNLSQSLASTVATESTIPGSTITAYDLYDGLGRIVQHQAKAVQSGGVMTDTAYDSQGRTISSTLPYWATAAPSSSLFIPTSMAQVPSRTDTVYDAAGRTTASILYTYGNESYRTTTGYPGADRVDVTPPTGGTPASTITNSAGQKTALTQYQAPTPTGSGLTTSYAYTPAGKLARMTDPAGNAWSWQYDLQGNQIVADDPDSGHTTSSYDLAGNVLSTTDARGQVLVYKYDDLNRKTEKRSGSITGPLLASWTYDTAAKGKPASATSYTGSTATTPGLAYVTSTDSYDDLYNPTSTTVKIPAGAPAFGGTTYTVTMTYNNAGLPQQRTLPAIGGLPLERIRIGYNGIGSVDNVQGATMYGVTSYSPTGQLAAITRGTSGYTLNTTFGYDPSTGQRNQVIDTASTPTGSGTQANRLYKRNPAGDVTSIQTTGLTGTDTQCFRYDAMRALTEAWTPSTTDCAADPTVAGLGGAAPYWTSYAVDPATGNRTSTTSHAAAGDTSTPYGYPVAGQPHPHAVASAGQSSYSYDASGNMITRDSQTLGWDESGKLSTVATAEGTEIRLYDADGNLLVQSDSKSGSRLFLSETELTLPPGASAISAVRTYTVAGVVVAERSTKVGTTGSSVAWDSGDLNGTQDIALDQATGALTRRFADPYGNPRGVSPLWGSSHGYLNAPVTTFGTLVQLGARAYDPLLGTFASVDEVLAPENPSQNNGYRYASNSPITFSDADGKCYNVTNDSLSMHTNCIGSKGSAAAPGPAYVKPGVGSSGNSSSDYGRYQVDKILRTKSSTSSWAQDTRCSGVCLGEGAAYNLITGFALGQAPKALHYGQGSSLLNGLMTDDATTAALAEIRKRLRNGERSTFEEDASYHSQDSKGLPNLLRDIKTYLLLASSGEEDKALAALGSYVATAKVANVDRGAHTADIIFSGSNISTAGSAFGLLPAVREPLNAWVTARDSIQGSGPFTPINETFTWKQTITW